MQDGNSANRAPISPAPNKRRGNSLDRALLDIKCGEDDWLDTYAPLMKGKGGRGPQPID